MFDFSVLFLACCCSFNNCFLILFLVDLCVLGENMYLSLKIVLTSSTDKKIFSSFPCTAYRGCDSEKRAKYPRVAAYTIYFRLHIVIRLFFPCCPHGFFRCIFFAPASDKARKTVCFPLTLLFLQRRTGFSAYSIL